MKIHPVTLQGRYVPLSPLALTHHPALSEVGLDEDLWCWAPASVRTPDEMRIYIESALQDQARASALPFAIVEKSSGRAVGSTRYGSIDSANRRVEIGWTWIARPWQRTVVNTEAKFLMLRHAFGWS